MRTVSKLAATAALALSIAVLSPATSAADVKMIAKVTSVKVAADGKSAVATLANSKGGAEVTVTVTDKTTLEMFADKRIRAGDEVRVSYDDDGGTNLSKTFKKSGGC